MATRLEDQSRGDEAVRVRTQHRSGWSLPAYEYLSQERYEHDVAIMRERLWFIAGHESQIPKTGDYKLFTFAQESIILVRDKTGAVNALYNVCRHRGSHVCREPQGNAKLLVCPYHSWTYRLDGTLLPPPSMPEDFNPKEYGLKPCHVSIEAGIIFVCLASGAPPDFEAFVAPLRAFLAPYALGRTKAVEEEKVLAASNWKMGIENFQECYHCPGAHQGMMRILSQHPPAIETPDEKGETWTARMRRLGRPVEPLFDEPSSHHLQQVVPLEIGRGHLSGSTDGKPRSKLLGDMTEWSGGWTLFSFNPFAHALMFDDYVQLISYTPVDVGKTAATMIWLVRDDAVESVDYDLRSLTKLMSDVMKEDVQITDDNQRGVLSWTYSPSPLSKEEAGVVRFHTWYLRHFGSDV
jgi:phenylpropionate dioxygenase-like ring-hydroxylating dioxygenase large terminal subunit